MKLKIKRIINMRDIICLLLNQLNSESEQNELQFKKLKTILKHAFYNVTFYKNKFKKNNISPEEIKNIDDLKKLPISNKKEMRKNQIGRAHV
jgi:phenylacetate-CoA ligase